MKRVISMFLLALPLLVAAKNYEIRADRAITSLVNSSEANVELIFSATGGNRVTYSSSEIEAPLKISVNYSGKLTIETSRKHNYKVSKVKVYYSGHISEIKNTGTGDIDCGKINAPGDLKLYNTGTGDIDITNINVKKLIIVNNGTGDVDIDGGKVIDLNIANNGTGDVEAKVKSSTATISNAGTGDITDVRQSTGSMVISNSGVGKVVIKKQANGGTVDIAPRADRNIRFIH